MGLETEKGGFEGRMMMMKDGFERDTARGHRRVKIKYREYSVLSIPLGLSRDKIWREKLFLCLVQIEINLCTLLSFCTENRKSFSRQFFSRDKLSGIDNN